MSNLFRKIPAVDKLLGEQAVAAAAKGLSQTETTALIREYLAVIRENAIQTETVPGYDQIIQECVVAIKNYRLGRFQPVINGTGVLLHTNLGRAPLPQKALDRIEQLGKSYFNLEIDLASGERGSRYTNVAKLFNLLTGTKTAAEIDTVIVNNNAAAVMVALKALAANQEVIVSRGQLVEIGGGFRVPEVIAASGCILKEVGTTNRTRLSDYENAITERTKAILLVHPSNYSIIGFTETTPREELARLVEKRGLLLIEDIGSGALPPFPEPQVTTALQESHIVTYSGDKLLGGPQAGIITGRRALLEVIKKEPLLRAVRIDKLSLLALEAVLELYLDKKYQELPLWALANQSLEQVKNRATTWLSKLGPGLEGEILPTHSTMGGGSLPGETIPSWALVLTSPKLSSTELAEFFRNATPSVIGKVFQDRFWLDPRTVLPEQEGDLFTILQKGVTICL